MIRYDMIRCIRLYPTSPLELLSSLITGSFSFSSFLLFCQDKASIEALALVLLLAPALISIDTEEEED